MPPVMLPGGQRVGVALAGTSLLCGCLSDPAVDPEVQPLGFVAGNPDPKFGRCILDVQQVAAGTHDVTAISMGGRGGYASRLDRAGRPRPSAG